MAKKHKKAKQQQAGAWGHPGGGAYGAGFGAAEANAGASPWGQPWGQGQAAPMGADFQAGMAAGFGSPGMGSGLGAGNGWMQQLPAFLRSSSAEQFVIGALVGAAAAWVLADDELRGKIVKSALKLYAGVAGGFEEMKEQMADLKAEVEAERQGDD